ncbi:MAG: ATP-dependent sacrificial sulfur transferase LarE [Planctomycetota bacterium]
MPDDIVESKYQKLQDILCSYGSVVIAYSGGVDSTFLAYVANQALGNKALNVTAVSGTYPESEHREAVTLAKQFGINHIVIRTDELHRPEFSANPPDRCYWCKQELFKKLKSIADKENIRFIADGSTVSDGADYRPGRRAACELEVKSPIAQAGLTKEEVRQLSQKLGIPTWDKPAYACLASRIPYGENITESKLRRVEKAENYISSLGFKTLRVRSHKNIARIEVPPEQFGPVIELRDRIIAELSALGYDYVTLDLEGYRSGSMNKELENEGVVGVAVERTVETCDCPVCYEQSLDRKNDKNIRYEQCPQCGSIWFGVNELSKALDSKVNFSLPANLTSLADREPVGTPGKTRLLCSCCATNLIKIKSLESPHIEVYACTVCQGRWVDAKEITRLQQSGLFNKIKNFLMSLF